MNQASLHGKELSKADSSLHCPHQGKFISGFQTASSRHPLGKPGNRKAFDAIENLSEIIRGRFTLDVRTQRENYFGESSSPQSLEQFTNAQFLRADVIKRRNASSQRMVMPSKSTGPLKRKNVGRLLDDTKKGGIALQTITDRAT